jgi:hypothetical protein
MLTAASVFGLILGQLQETYAVANQRAREMEDHIDSIFTFLQENRLAAHTSSAQCFTLWYYCGLTTFQISTDTVANIWVYNHPASRNLIFKLISVWDTHHLYSSQTVSGYDNEHPVSNTLHESNYAYILFRFSAQGTSSTGAQDIQLDSIPIPDRAPGRSGWLSKNRNKSPDPAVPARTIRQGFGYTFTMAQIFFVWWTDVLFLLHDSF